MTQGSEVTSRPVFSVDAQRVMQNLRAALSRVVADLGDVRKPADMQKALSLDWTLSWQVYRIAVSPGAGGGWSVPSRSSMHRFFGAARKGGVAEPVLAEALGAYEDFERLVEEHAGERTIFNSMVAAVGSEDDWEANDSQHRRNIFRGLSHSTGMQGKSMLKCSVVMPRDDSWDILVLGGIYDLRVLRSLPVVQVFRSRVFGPHVRDQCTREPLYDPADHCNGFLLPDYSSRDIPNLRAVELDAGWIVAELTQPGIGITAATSLAFASVYRRHPVPGLHGTLPRYFSDVFVDKPVETLVTDVLIPAAATRGIRPTVEAYFGNSSTDRAPLPGDLVPLLGKYNVEYLGTGSDAAASTDIPRYPDMLRDCASRLSWNLDTHELWRLRVTFPLYQCTVRIRWDW